MLQTDLQEGNGNNSNKMISKGKKLHFNPAAPSLQIMAKTVKQTVICLAAFETESQYTAVRSVGVDEDFLKILL